MKNGKSLTFSRNWIPALDVAGRSGLFYCYHSIVFPSLWLFDYSSSIIKNTPIIENRKLKWYNILWHFMHACIQSFMYYICLINTYVPALNAGELILSSSCCFTKSKFWYICLLDISCFSDAVLFGIWYILTNSCWKKWMKHRPIFLQEKTNSLGPNFERQEEAWVFQDNMSDISIPEI